MLYARGELFKYQKFDRGNLKGINLSTCVTGANFTKKVFFANYYSERYYPIYTLNASCEKFIRDFYIMLFPHHGTRERVVFDNFNTRSHTHLIISIRIIHVFASFRSHFARAHMAWGARVALRRASRNRLKIGVRREGTVSNGLLES